MSRIRVYDETLNLAHALNAMTMLPSLQLRPISTSHYYLSGDVVIEGGVAIAPGVLIQADPSTQVIIHAGVVIGSGTVIHANHGTLEIGAGTIIGAEVLLMGSIQIGEQVCIGAASTIFHRPLLMGKAGLQILPGELIPPGSLLGDASRQPESAPKVAAEANSKVDPHAHTPSSFSTTAVKSQSNGQTPPFVSTEPATADRPTSFSSAATHGFVGVAQPTPGATPSGVAESSFREPNSYFQAPAPPPDLPHQPFTEHPPTPLGTPPPPTSVPPQPGYPGPYTMPKADIPPPVAPLHENSLDPAPTAIQPTTNGAGTVNYVNQMLGRMFPYRQT